MRAIRHGVGRNGRPLLMMPTDAFYYISDEDLANSLAYLKTIPAVTRGATRQYGDYLATTGSCKGCHLEDLSGGAPIEKNVLSSNLTPTGIGKWTEADFTKALREGIRPDGKVLSAVMPWPYTRFMSDDEIHALWLYIRLVPPRNTGGD